MDGLHLDYLHCSKSAVNTRKPNPRNSLFPKFSTQVPFHRILKRRCHYDPWSRCNFPKHIFPVNGNEAFGCFRMRARVNRFFKMHKAVFAYLLHFKTLMICPNQKRWIWNLSSKSWNWASNANPSLHVLWSQCLQCSKTKFRLVKICAISLHPIIQLRWLIDHSIGHVLCVEQLWRYLSNFYTTK